MGHGCDGEVLRCDAVARGIVINRVLRPSQTPHLQLRAYPLYVRGISITTKTGADMHSPYNLLYFTRIMYYAV
jgi:hypothetical protein